MGQEGRLLDLPKLRHALIPLVDNLLTEFIERRKAAIDQLIVYGTMH